MSDGEFYVLIISLIYSFYSLKVWFKEVSATKSMNNKVMIKLIFRMLPFLSSAIILVTIFNLADPTVVQYPVFIFMYLFLGLTWNSLGLYMLFFALDISWRDDGVYHGNPAALWSIAGSFLALTFIYSGANIGEGPGWWCVIFAGAIGMIAFFGLLSMLNKRTDFGERITIDRDLSCGIRMGALMIAMGMILGRASAGNWTSFSMTVYEFLIGWPVLILLGIALVIETNFKKQYRLSHSKIGINRSIIIGIVYVIFAILTVVLLPSV